VKNIENHLVAFTRIDEIPTLPEAARVAITKTLSFEKSADEIAAIVKKTPSLTLKLLKLANSSYYSRGRKVATTRDAIMRLGYRTVKSLILSLSIKDIFQEARSDLFEYRRFWLHSIATGVIAEEIQKTLTVKLENDAYSAGLLHDVGKVFFSIADPDRYAEVVRMVRTKRMSFVDAERETYGFDHTDTAYFLFEQWDLPPFLGTAVRMHHAGPEETGFSAHGAIVALSNQLSHMSGYNIDPAEPPYQADPRLIKELGLKKDDLDTVMRELKDHLEPFAEALNIPHSDIKGYFETLSSANRELGSMFLTTQQAGESLDRKEHLCVALNRLSLLFLSTEGSAEPLKEAVRLMIETFALESAALEVYMERETSNLIGGFRPPDGKGIEVQEKTVERGRTPRFEDMTAVPVSSDGREVGRVYYAKREELSEKDLVVFVDQLAVGFRNLQLHQEKKTGNA
jgi:HD-like signal output (HDOD) protein